VTRPDIHALIVAVATLGMLVLFSEPVWKPWLIEWLTSKPVIVMECKRAV
jgi:hypothetical protein